MLDIERGWEEFNKFENYVFNPDDEDFFQFTGKWNIRSKVYIFVKTSVSDPDPYHLVGSGSVSGNVDMDPGSAKN